MLAVWAPQHGETTNDPLKLQGDKHFIFHRCRILFCLIQNQKRNNARTHHVYSRSHHATSLHYSFTNLEFLVYSNSEIAPIGGIILYKLKNTIEDNDGWGVYVKLAAGKRKYLFLFGIKIVELRAGGWDGPECKSAG
jgi:hypothetical protein